jgi:predicted metal-binding protein
VKFVALFFGAGSMLDGNDLVKIALESSATQAALLDTLKIQFHEDFRKACEKNFCRKYDTNWMGPPAIGTIETLKARALHYEQGLLFQTVHAVASNFDMKGMLEGAKKHQAVFQILLAKIREKYPQEDILALNAGCCSICPKCAYLDQQPCRNPDQAASSVEAYGMNVIAMEKSAGIPVHYGKTAIAYVGLILFNKLGAPAILPTNNE